MKKKKPLVVTLADENYLEQAKQVFASLYFKGGWKGDYMLLAHDVPRKKLKWFYQKKILVKQCKPIYKEKVAETPISFTSRFYLFTNEFKKWSHVIYLDADIIVRGSLDSLLQVSGFAAVEDLMHVSLTNEVISKERFLARGYSPKDYYPYRKLIIKHYNLRRRSFCAGMFVFNTKIIRTNTFDGLLGIVEKYHPIAANADQFALNLYFYDRWEKLMPIYDFYIYEGRNQWDLPSDRIDGIILHFMGGKKPWAEGNFFYKEWSSNYRMADKINLQSIPEGRTWSPLRQRSFSTYLTLREVFNYARLKTSHPRGYYFRIMFYVEKNFPSFFLILKKTKKAIKNKFSTNVS